MSLLKTSSVNFEKLWEDIQPSLLSLVSGVPQSMTNERWLEMYNGIYKICTNPQVPQAELLFFRLRSLLVIHVERILDDLRRVPGHVEFLQAYCCRFRSFTTGTSFISELFRYLNRYWISYSHCESGQAPVPGVYPVTELALHIWHDIAFLKLRKKVIASVMHVFRIVRNGRSEVFDDGDLIASLVETYFALGAIRKDPMALYREDLEAPFLEDTAQYYSELARDLLSKVTIAEYLREVELLCKQEQRRCEGRMHRTTVTQARQTCCRVLVDEHAERICEDAETFLINNQTQDLHRLFSLFSELPKDQALISFKNILKKYIERSGLDVVRKFEHEDAARNPEGYIEALVQVRNKYFELIKDAFGFHALMRTALDQACRAFANSHPRLPELLAKYTHYLMTHDRKKHTMNSPIKPAYRSAGSVPQITSLVMEETLDKKIENISVVFCLIDDKDVFKKYYAKFLAKRLIKGTSIANDLEIVLIQKLREICGCDFVSKLQKMLKDKILSKELTNSFGSWLHESEDELTKTNPHSVHALHLHRRIEYHCDVLTAGAWPISSAPSDPLLLLPSEIESHVELFSKFYTDRSTGRKLLWVHHLSSGVLQANCFDKRYEFSLSFYQMLIIMLFNSQDSLTGAEMVQQTNIPEKELKHHVASLVKAKILKLSEEQKYSLNSSFSSKKTRVSVLPSSPVESPKVAKATVREVEEDRKMALQAAIVRVMKTRRDILQQQLQVEVAEMLRNQFVPSTTSMKQNIDILIQKEYMRRHDSDELRLLYVA
ncbi:hypothetical protein PINS_up000346 [Pythium insidiosum]|nr:hypothetical protein PINS_up000346 [Pythium insidiosum]